MPNRSILCLKGGGIVRLHPIDPRCPALLWEMQLLLAFNANFQTFLEMQLPMDVNSPFRATI